MISILSHSPLSPHLPPTIFSTSSTRKSTSNIRNKQLTLKCVFAHVLVSSQLLASSLTLGTNSKYKVSTSHQYRAKLWASLREFVSNPRRIMFISPVDAFFNLSFFFFSISRLSQMKRFFPPWGFLICFEVALEAIRLRDSSNGQNRKTNFWKLWTGPTLTSFETREEWSDKCSSGASTINTTDAPGIPE